MATKPKLLPWRRKARTKSKTNGKLTAAKPLRSPRQPDFPFPGEIRERRPFLYDDLQAAARWLKGLITSPELPSSGLGLPEDAVRSMAAECGVPWRLVVEARPKFARLDGVREWLRVWRDQDGDLHIELDALDYAEHGPSKLPLPPEGWGKFLGEIAIAIATEKAGTPTTAGEALHGIMEGWKDRIVNQGQ